MGFKVFSLQKEIIQAIEEKGYTQPTPIQEKAIPLVLQGRDVLAGAQTGTGKTAGFTLPLLQILSTQNKPVGPGRVRALILTPTRELAMQVEESVKTYGKYLPLKSTVIFGGVNIQGQINRLRKGVDILIATPGRLLDLVKQKALDLSAVEVLVLDEADRMLDMGFIQDIRRVIAFLPRKRQTLLFSATFSSEIKELAKGLLLSPQVIEVAKSNVTAEGIAQEVYLVDKRRKQELLSYLISSEKWEQVLVFTRTKHAANRLSTELESKGIGSAVIHGNKSQNARIKALSDFKSGSLRVLVATDIAARGLDIHQLPYVVNFELPHVPEDYVHRIGRTGRAGNLGKAVSLVCIDERDLLKNIEKLVRQELPKITHPDYKPDPSIKAEPIINGRRTAPGSRGPQKPQTARQGRPQSRSQGSYNSNYRRDDAQKKYR